MYSQDEKQLQKDKVQVEMRLPTKTPHKLSPGSTKLNDSDIKTCTRASRSRFSSPRIPICIPKCKKSRKTESAPEGLYINQNHLCATHAERSLFLSSSSSRVLTPDQFPNNRFGEHMGTCSHIPNTLWRVVANVLYTGIQEFAKIVEFSCRSSQSSPLSEHVPDSIYFVAILFFIGGLTAVYLQQSGWMNGGARNEIQLTVLLGMRNHLFMTIIQHRVAIFVAQLSTCCHMHSPVRIAGVRYVHRILTGIFLESSLFRSQVRKSTYLVPMLLNYWWVDRRRVIKTNGWHTGCSSFWMTNNLSMRFIQDGCCEIGSMNHRTCALPFCEIGDSEQNEPYSHKLVAAWIRI